MACRCRLRGLRACRRPACLRAARPGRNGFATLDVDQATLEAVGDDARAKADALAVPAAVDIEGSGYGLVVADTVALVAGPVDPTATFSGPLESALRLVGGRLRPATTPDGVTVTGAVSLDDLRRVFPGY